MIKITILITNFLGWIPRCDYLCTRSEGCNSSCWILQSILKLSPWPKCYYDTQRLCHRRLSQTGMTVKWNGFGWLLIVVTEGNWITHIWIMEHLNKRFYLFIFGCPVIVYFLSHDLITKLKVWYSSHQSRNLSVKLKAFIWGLFLTSLK